MKRNANHSLLQKAKTNKKDEFYTQLIDIESELEYYSHQFRGKVVYCNCDDVRYSNFFRYFVSNFSRLGLRKVICSCYMKNEYDSLDSSFKPGFYYEYTGVENKEPGFKDVTFFKGDGDFRGEESISLLKQADIVVTNPPFSLFREYVDQLVAFDKSFLIIGNINILTYKNIFSLIKDNKAWLGVNLGRGISGFIVPTDYELYGLEVRINDEGQRIVSTNNCLWFTNLDNQQRHEFIPLDKKYRGHENEYPFFDNFNGINVNRTKDIPMDFDGVIGVPITFLHKFNPDQFEIVKYRKGDDGKDLTINGKPTYFRILVKQKKTSK